MSSYAKQQPYTVNRLRPSATVTSNPASALTVEALSTCSWGNTGRGLDMLERHADPLDEAAALAATLTDGAIEAARRASEPETHPDFDGESCIDCGDTIPDKRLALGKIRCIHCQTVKEHREKQTARPGWSQPGWTGFDD